jgi:hypothetical protein
MQIALKVLILYQWIKGFKLLPFTATDAEERSNRMASNRAA